MVSPSFRIRWPIPPPRVRPPMPVWVTMPPVTARPNACVSRSTWLHSAPPPARALRDSGSTRTDVIGERSMRTPPSHKAWPATAWPPPRTEISNPRSRANRSTARTSAVPVQLAMRAGRRRIAPFQIERTSS